MLLKNSQGCEIRLKAAFFQGKNHVKKTTIYPTGSIDSDMLSDEKAQEMVQLLITDHAFKIIF